MQTINIFLITFFILTTNLTFGIDYYFDSKRGRDTSEGQSITFPFKNLSKIETLNLKPGDRILLAVETPFQGTIKLKDVHGTPENPIEILSYSIDNRLENPKAMIDASGYANGIWVIDCSHIRIQNLSISANAGGIKDGKDIGMRCGILITTSKAGEYGGIELKDLSIQNVFFEERGFQRGKEEVRTANGSQQYGWGIRFINRTEGAFLENLTVSSCTVENVAHTGIKFTGRNHNIKNLKVYNNRVLKTGGPGIQMSGIKDGHIKGNYVAGSGSSDDSRKWGRGSGLWTWGSMDVVIENNYFMNANGPGDSAGCHIDFNCKNVVVQYNFSANNAGGFCEILGNNFNCAYRYNISVNDGYRVKGKNGAFQEGKIFWLSGYVGKKRKRHGPYNSYFYNNTIYMKEDIIAKIAVAKTTSGVLLANNIFYIEGKVQAVLGDQYNPERGEGGNIENVFFQKNLFLKADFWPEAVLIQPQNITTGDPNFMNPGGLDIRDYIPQNHSLIKNKGISIPAIPQDSIGLSIGLEVKQDILGNPVKAKPDLGAIEIVF